jgi:hypothetical protein
MSQSYKRAMATLTNGQIISVYNMDQSAEFDSAMVLSGKNIETVSSQGTKQYKFSNPSSGWFTSIATEDTDRFILGTTVVVSGDDILTKVSPLKTYSTNEFDKLVGGAK